MQFKLYSLAALALVSINVSISPALACGVNGMGCGMQMPTTQQLAMSIIMFLANQLLHVATSAWPFALVGVMFAVYYKSLFRALEQTA